MTTFRLQPIRAKIRDRTDRGWVGRDMVDVVDGLNSVPRGWGGSFRHGNSARKFAVIDSYAHERLAILASNKHRLRGRNWGSSYTYNWLSDLAIYRLSGNVRRWTPAHASR